VEYPIDYKLFDDFCVHLVSPLLDLIIAYAIYATDIGLLTGSIL